MESQPQENQDAVNIEQVVISDSLLSDNVNVLRMGVMANDSWTWPTYSFFTQYGDLGNPANPIARIGPGFTSWSFTGLGMPGEEKVYRDTMMRALQNSFGATNGRINGTNNSVSTLKAVDTHLGGQINGLLGWQTAQQALNAVLENGLASVAGVPGQIAWYDNNIKPLAYDNQTRLNYFDNNYVPKINDLASWKTAQQLWNSSMENWQIDQKYLNGQLESKITWYDDNIKPKVLNNETRLDYIDKNYVPVIDDLKLFKSSQELLNNALTAKNANQDERLDATQAKNANQDERLDATQAKNANQDERLDATQAQNILQDERLDATQAQNILQDQRLDVTQAKNATQDERLDAIQAKNTTQDERLDATQIKNGNQDNTLKNIDNRLQQIESFDFSSIIDLTILVTAINAVGTKVQKLIDVFDVTTITPDTFAFFLQANIKTQTDAITQALAMVDESLNDNFVNYFSDSKNGQFWTAYKDFSDFQMAVFFGVFFESLQEDWESNWLTVLDVWNTTNSFLATIAGWLDQIQVGVADSKEILSIITNWLKIIYEKPIASVNVPSFDYLRLEGMLEKLEFGEVVNEAGTNIWDFLTSLVDNLGDIITTQLEEFTKVLSEILDFLDGLIDKMIGLIVPKNLDFMRQGFDDVNLKFKAKFGDFLNISASITQMFQPIEKDFVSELSFDFMGVPFVPDITILATFVPKFRNVVALLMWFNVGWWAFRRFTGTGDIVNDN